MPWTDIRFKSKSQFNPTLKALSKKVMVVVDILERLNVIGVKL